MSSLQWSAEERQAVRKTSRLLIVPGLGDSDENHWQSIWELEFGASRVQQDNWNHPRLEAWLERLHDSVQKKPGAILVAHSLGCILTAHFSNRYPDAAVAGAFLVAPADVDHLQNLPASLASFAPTPRHRLNFSSVVVASTNDPYVSIEWARSAAQVWGSRFIDVGASGHINSSSGFGTWPEGIKLLREFAAATSASARADNSYLSDRLPAYPVDLERIDS